jgi:hypothetical protein
LAARFVRVEEVVGSVGSNPAAPTIVEYGRFLSAIAQYFLYMQVSQRNFVMCSEQIHTVCSAWDRFVFLIL